MSETTSLFFALESRSLVGADGTNHAVPSDDWDAHLKLAADCVENDPFSFLKVFAADA
jgi:hypothetical protein